MQIAKAKLCRVPMLRVAGDVDHLTSPALLRAVEDALDPKTACILLDLEACPYLDSGGISVLLQTLKKMKSRLGWLGVIAPTRDVDRLLEIVGLRLDSDFRVFPNITAAQDELGAEALRN